MRLFFVLCQGVRVVKTAILGGAGGGTLQRFRNQKQKIKNKKKEKNEKT